MIDISSVLNGSKQCSACVLRGLPVTGSEERDQAEIKRTDGGEEAPQHKGTGDNRVEPGPDRHRQTGPDVEGSGVK